MFNDNIIRVPINGTAARVSSQSGCLDEQTPAQERESIQDHLAVIEVEMLALPKNSKQRKSLGAKKAMLCSRISELKKKMKILGFGTENRVDQLDYVISAMKLHLSDMQYRRIMSKAFAMSQEDLASVKPHPIGKE